MEANKLIKFSKETHIKGEHRTPSGIIMTISACIPTETVLYVDVDYEHFEMLSCSDLTKNVQWCVYPNSMCYTYVDSNDHEITNLESLTSNMLHEKYRMIGKRVNVRPQLQYVPNGESGRSQYVLDQLVQDFEYATSGEWSFNGEQIISTDQLDCELFYTNDAINDPNGDNAKFIVNTHKYMYEILELAREGLMYRNEKD